MSGIGSGENPGALLAAAMVEQLAASLPVSVFDGSPARAGDPYVVVDEPVLVDWSTKSWRGREGRIAVQFLDGGERPTRLRRLAGAAEEALEDWQPVLAGGWRLIGVRLARSRLLRERDGRWRGVSEFAVRMWREDA